MRKILIIFILMVSSFFVFNNKASASTTYTFEIPETDFEFINDEFYELREKITAYCNENNKSYIIGGISSTAARFAYVFDYSSHTTNIFSTMPYISFNSSTMVFKLVDGELTQTTTKETHQTSFYNSSSEFSLRNFLDTNIENIYNTSSLYAWTFTYGDLTYTINQNDKFPTLYEIYLDVYGSEEPEEEVVVRNESLDSFYSLVIEKIQLFANSFINNDVLLFVIGIFILIFVIELVRRYLL